MASLTKHQQQQHTQYSPTGGILGGKSVADLTPTMAGREVVSHRSSGRKTLFKSMPKHHCYEKTLFFSLILISHFI